jgi:hypothetical protein
MGPEDFEKVKRQIGRCGIWCGSCVVGNGALGELTRRYKRLVETYGLRDWGPKDLDYDEFVRALDSIQSVAHRPGCISGGGQDACVLRPCVVARELSDCSDCREYPSCPHAEQLEKMRSGAVSAGLFVRKPGEGREDALREWIEEVASRWPHSVLFDEHENQRR